MENNNKALKSGITIIVFTLFTKLLGFFREVLIAAKFGSGMETDTFFIALSVAALITNFLREGISTSFIPILGEISEKKGKLAKVEHTNKMINLMIIISLVLVIFMFIFAPFIVKIFAKGFEKNQFDSAVRLTRIGLPMILFSGITGILIGYLQSEEKFNSTAIIGVPFNIIYIAYLLLLSSKFGITGLMIAAVVAVFSQLIVQILAANKVGFYYEAVISFRDKYIQKTLKLSIPVLIGVAIYDVNAIIDKTLASSLKPGSISALNYANKLNVLILGVFISAITTVVFPTLSKEANKDNIIGVRNITRYGINLILIITIPATIGLIIFANPIVEIVFQRGEFGIQNTLMTSSALVFYSLGLVFISIRLLLIRTFYSIQDTKTPMKIEIIGVVSNLIFNLILIRFMDHSGLALGTSLAAGVSTVLLIYAIKKKIGSFDSLFYMKYISKLLLASCIMGIISFVIFKYLYIMIGISKFNLLVSLFIAIFLGIIFYILACYFLKIEEVRELIKKIKYKY